MHAELKKDDASLQKQSSDRHRESIAHVDRDSDLLSGESTEGFTSSGSHALPPTGQGQLPMQFKGLSEKPEPKNLSDQLVQRRVNKSGLPDNLKNGIENLSGYSMDDVKVHYNSSKPAQLRAHAYTQGTVIHVAPGQEQHLPHEAWHVVQQKQSRVKPTLQMKDRINVNDDADLEKEADVMGAKALSTTETRMPSKVMAPTLLPEISTIQRKGERTAVKSTLDDTRYAKEPIRRGNRRGSVTDTEGFSPVKLGFFRYYFGNPENKGSILEYIEKRIRSSKKYRQRSKRKQVFQLIRENLTFVIAKAVEEVSAGNCGEFSKVVYAHLVQNTTDQFVYRARMNGQIPKKNPEDKPQNYDHAFVLTSPDDIAVTPNITNITGLDEETTTVADAWDAYHVMTLKQFKDEQNPYGAVLENDNIVIIEKRQAMGNDVLDKDIQGYIRDWAIQKHKEFIKLKEGNEAYKTAAAQNKKKPQGFDFNITVNETFGVDDLREKMDVFKNSTDEEKKEYLKTLSITELQHLL